MSTRRTPHYEHNLYIHIWLNYAQSNVASNNCMQYIKLYVYTDSRRIAMKAQLENLNSI